MVDEMVSIVMATYNGEKYLRPQLDSILEQTYRHFELIVVDDASTDGTLSILNEYGAVDGRVHIFPAEKNLGFVANFERGLRLARGDFIALSDQDDIFRKDKIELLLSALKGQPNCDLAVSDLSLIDEVDAEFATSIWRYQKLKPQQGKPFRRLLYLNFATGCAMMFRRRLLGIALPFPSDCRVHDWWLAVVAASSKGGGICLIKEPLTAYRQHRSNVLGAKAVDNVSIRKIVARIKTSPRGMSVVEERLKFIKPNIANLVGYLQRDFWSDDEWAMINSIKNTLEGYLTDVHSDFLSRICKLPQRLRCAVSTRRLTNCIAVILATLWPYK